MRLSDYFLLSYLLHIHWKIVDRFIFSYSLKIKENTTKQFINIHVMHAFSGRKLNNLSAIRQAYILLSYFTQTLKNCFLFDFLTHNTLKLKLKKIYQIFTVKQLFSGRKFINFTLICH